MTKRTKRFLFYSAVAVFLLLSYIVILYAQGYKYSFSEGEFFRTGAISLKINESAEVFLDNEFKGETSFFGNSFSIDRLLPEVYRLSVQKDDYSFWQKRVSVEEGLVIDFSTIMLLPEEGEEEQKLFEEVAELFKNLEPIPTLTPTRTPRPIKGSPLPSPSLTPKPGEEPFILNAQTKTLTRYNEGDNEEIAVNVKGFRISKNNNKLAWWTENELWVLWLADQNYQPTYKKGDREMIIRFPLPVQNASWFRGEDHIVLELEAHDSKNRPYSIYRVVETDIRGGVNVIEL